jgi:nitrite reductase/ring-hydroxylating ferredoxin subunit
MTNRIRIGEAKDWAVGELKSVDAGGKTIVVGRTDDGFCGVVGKCPHLGLPIGGGKMVGDTITCPWHNSRFNMCTGENLDWAPGLVGVRMPSWSRPILAMGKKPTPIQTFKIFEDDGALFVEE